MCDICRNTPCINGCPNQDESIVGSCHYCGEILLDFYEIWTDFEGNLYCDEDCAMKHYEIKEKI